MKRATATVGLWLLTLVSAWAQTEEETPDRPETAKKSSLGVGIRYRLWVATLDGDLSSSTLVLPGTEIDLDSDLEIESHEPVHGLNAWVRLPFLDLINGSLRADWWRGSFEGENSIDKAIQFSGTTFAVGTEVESSLDLDILTAVLDMTLLGESLVGAPTEVAVQIGLKYLRADGELKSSLFSEDEALSGAIPVVGVRGKIGLGGWLEAELEANGLSITLGDQRVGILDLSLELMARPWKGLTLGVGYRFIDFSFDDEGGDDGEEVEADLEIDGIFFTVGYQF